MVSLGDGQMLLRFFYHSKRLLRRLTVSARPEIISASISLNFMALATPIVVLQLYDRIIPNNSSATLFTLISALVIVLFFEFILTTCRTSLMNKLGARFERDLHASMMNKIINSDFTKFCENRSSYYIDKIRSISQVKESYYGAHILAFFDLPFIAIFFLMIWFFSGSLVVVPLVLFFLFISFSIIMALRLRRFMIEKDKLSEQRHNFLIETLQGMQTIKPMAMEPLMLRRYERLQISLSSVIYEVTRINNWVQSASMSFSQIIMVSFVVMGAIMVVDGNLSVGALAAGTMLSGRLLQPASRLMVFWTQTKISELYP